MVVEGGGEGSRGERRGEGKWAQHAGTGGSGCQREQRDTTAVCGSKRLLLLIPQCNLEFTTALHLYGTQPGGGGGGGGGM